MIGCPSSLLAGARVFRLAFGVTVFLLMAADPTRAEVRFARTVQSVTVAPDEQRCDFRFLEDAVLRVEVLAADVLRLRFNPTGTFTTRLSGAISRTPFEPFTANIFDSADATYITTNRLLVIIGKSPFRIHIMRPDGSAVLTDLDDAYGWDTDSGVVFTRKFAPPDERYFGFGERGGPIDRRGRRFFMMNVDTAAYGEFADPLYISIPFYYGLRDGKAYGIFLDNPAFPVFNVDPEYNGTLTFGALEGELDYYVMTGPSPPSIANAYLRLTGFAPLPPKWTLGYHQSRFGYTSQSEMLDVAATLRRLRFPCDVLYFDLYYHDNLQILSWDPWRFPDPLAMNRALAADGFRRVNIVDPVVLPADRLYPYLKASDFLLKDAAGNPLVNEIFYGHVSWIDFTKPALRSWYKEVFKTFLATGVDGVWNDLNEPAQSFMPESIYDFGGERRTDLQARNLYALQITSLTYETMKELRPNTRPWIFSRAGFSGIQRYSSNWGGDANTSFDSLRVSVQMSISMGLSGQNQFGHDIGGFLGAPSPELFIRWMQFGAFIPIFRNHATDTTPPREPWVFGEPYTTMARDIINQRYRLLPYLYTITEAASRTGEPTLAPTMFYFPEDSGTYTQDQEFMLGPALLVAPVVEEGATTRSLYLPGPAPVEWYDYYDYTAQPLIGGTTVTVSAPLARIPVFVREGAIIPHAPVIQHVNEPHDGRLTVEIFPGRQTESSFTLYEDDGESFDYTDGRFLRTQLRRTDTAGGQLLQIKPLNPGRYVTAPRSWWLSFRLITSVPAGVEVNDVAFTRFTSVDALNDVLEGWAYDHTLKRVVVKLNDSSSSLQSVFIRQ